MTSSITASAAAGSRHGLKKDKVIYWTSTGIVAAVMIFSIVNFVFNDHFPFPNGPEGSFQHLLLPHYFKIELVTAKIIGLFALLVPGVPRLIKQFAYFGFGLTLISAAVAHYSVGDVRNHSVIYVLDPLSFFVLLVVSYVYWNKLARV
jgi:hypothetical protein